MMHNDMLQAVDYLREKANVSYEEAIQLLEAHGNDVMRVMVELEKSGRLYSQGASQSEPTNKSACHAEIKKAKRKAASFFRDVRQMRLVIYKKGEDGEQSNVTSISALGATIVVLCLPRISVAATALGFIAGYRARTEKVSPEDVA